MEACLCMADETFKSPHTAGVQCGSESGEESDDDLEDEEDRNGIRGLVRVPIYQRPKSRI